MISEYEDQISLWKNDTDNERAPILKGPIDISKDTAIDIVSQVLGRKAAEKLAGMPQQNTGRIYASLWKRDRGPALGGKVEPPREKQESKAPPKPADIGFDDSDLQF